MFSLRTTYFILLSVFWSVNSSSGDIDSPALPSDANSAMYGLQDIYDRLNTGASGSKRSGAFSEPASAPGSTTPTLNQIMGKAPSADDTNGASPSQVLEGKTFWGRRSNEWGNKTGSMPNQGGANISPDFSSGNHPIPQGYYSGAGAIHKDSSLVGSNIKCGVNIFGITGALNCTESPPTIQTPIDIPKTGQSISYAAGDDGDLQKGVAWPEPRFTDNNDGTVTDNLIGLVWLKNLNCAGSMNWYDALDFSNSLFDGAIIDPAGGDCGLSDGSIARAWRLPNLWELASLIDYNEKSPALPATHPFTGANGEYYWSSTTRMTGENISSAGSARTININKGFQGNSDKTDSWHVWPVKEGLSTPPAPIYITGQKTSYSGGDDGDLEKGIATPKPRFTDNGDGTILDNLTNLIWLKNADCIKSINASFDNDGTAGDGAVTWQHALDFIAGINAGTYNCADTSNSGTHQADWRLPNINEIRTLFVIQSYGVQLSNTAGDGQWVEGDPFINIDTTRSTYWTSTTSPVYTDMAYRVSIYPSGGFSHIDKGDYPMKVWPVRGGK